MTTRSPSLFVLGPTAWVLIVAVLLVVFALALIYIE